MRVALAVLCTAGCSQVFGLTEPSRTSGDGSVLDDSGTPDDDVAVSGTCLGLGNYRVCVAIAPTMAVALPDSINTSSNPLCATTQPNGWAAQGQPAICLIAGTTISAALTRVTGSRPLVLFALTSFTVSTGLDVASHGSNGATGPAGSSMECAQFAGMPEADSNGAGGGAGGSFMTIGGTGGDGDAMTYAGGSPAPALTMRPAHLRGGCIGQPGGMGQQGPLVPGAGGGVIYIVAGQDIMLGGGAVINASGAGGQAVGKGSGGTGGGSGGMIVLSSPTITVGAAARVFANGGGASSGGTNSGNSQNGEDPSQPLQPAQGGNTGTDGGDGFVQTIAAVSGNDGAAGAGGGGGGGGGGLIISSRGLAGAEVSPTAILGDP